MSHATYLFTIALGSILVFHAVSRSEPGRGPKTGMRIDLQQLSWMKGTWTRQEGEQHQEEHWTSPDGGTMMGVARTIVGTRTVEFEFLRIVQTKPDRIVYYASPGGRCPATPFELKQIGSERVVFENLDYDFPQRIIYWRDTDGSLHARIEGDLNGKPQHLEWTWPPQESS